MCWPKVDKQNKTLWIIRTVHKDVTERLPLLNEVVAGQVREILANNKAERHLRGGMATKRKYEHLAEGAE